MEDAGLLVQPADAAGHNQSSEITSKEILRIIEEQLNWIPNPTTLYSLIIIYSLMMIIAFLLNITIFFTVLLSKNLRKPNILLSLNLIIANILTSSICMPFTMNSIIFKFWTFNELLCKAIPFIQSTTVFVISTTVTFISMDRYFMITSLKKTNFKLLKPLSNLSNNKLKIFANLTIWLLATVLSCPILFYQQLVHVGIKGVYVKKVCAEQYPDDRFRIVYAVLTFVIAFVIPLLTLSYFHYKIKCFLNDHLLRFDLSREKLLNNGSTTIKTISSKNPQSLFMAMSAKRASSEANYYSLIDLNLFNSSDLHSSPTQTRECSPFNSDLEKSRLSFKRLNPRKKLDKSLTLSNNFQFDCYLPIYARTNKNSFLTGDRVPIDKISSKKALSAETVLSANKNCSPNSLSLGQLNHDSLNQLKLNCSELIDSSVNNSSANNSTSKSSQTKSKHKDREPAKEGILATEADQRRRPLNKRLSKRQDSLGYALICRSLSDSNLLDLAQPLHNSFLHELNPPHSLLTNLDRRPPADHHPSTMIVSPSFSSQGFNLDYLRLVNFDFNQRPNAILRHPEAANRLSKPRRSEQLKIASITRYSRFSCFLKRLKQFHYLNKELQRNQKITFILVSCIVIFAISWLPLNVFNLYFDFNHDARDISVPKVYLIYSICHILAMSSAITNGLLYGLLNTNIQKELIKLFKNCLHSKRKAGR